jgi:hypothetical protein
MKSSMDRMISRLSPDPYTQPDFMSTMPVSFPEPQYVLPGIMVEDCLPHRTCLLVIWYFARKRSALYRTRSKMQAPL